MIRHVAVVVVALCLSPSSVFAQGATFTVTAPSAAVYKNPSTGSIVIGQVERGAVLEITRELGSWVKVAWPAGPDGIGYMHVSNGSIARGTATPSMKPAATASMTAGDTATRAESRAQTNGGTAAPRANVSTRSVSHRVGVGGGIAGTTFGVGASARTWTRKRIGVQFAVTRDARTSVDSSERVSTLRFAPSVLWPLRNHVSDYVWLRPYVGGGATLSRSTLTGGALDTGASRSAHGWGIQGFGGSEMTFASIPQVSLSADLAYRWSDTPFQGFDLSGFGFSIAAHWYIK